MTIVGRKALVNFKKKHGDCRSQVDEWIKEVESAEWKSFNDIKKIYPHASILNDNTVIFNLKGNKYRLVTVVVIVADRVFIEWVGTHEEYNKMKF